jgi:hypothetical protein
MKPSSRPIRRALWLGATAAAALALTVSGVTSPVAAQPTLHSAASDEGPGYPPPGGIYTPFTDCPIANPLMQETPRALTQRPVGVPSLRARPGT